ncbi:MAG: hypothetical protein AVDCRST_MAG20-2730 [uncultured Acidimicrobiales bacterium]|uniref:Integral membrane protein n=1 Tax=uncultured Acidimicrobiales bacterium TaxID=310071 RepID=A0A6J4IWW5_9ACTN|nr:MAG: hypothetical protein AVDCRST_MAG20-2730 [uncultured Acidimicrobiales bacterium]
MWLATRLVLDRSMAEVASTWDGGWYLAIAGGGYPTSVPAAGGSTLAFFPVYPLLVRAVDRLPLVTPIGAGLLVSGVASVGAAVVIWLLGRHLLGADAADRAVALLAFFPGSFVLSMVYAEGVMLLVTAGCLLALVRERWLTAGVLAAVATATRPNAAAVIGSCGWAALVAIRSRGAWRSLVAPALAPLGILGFFAYLWARTGEATAWFDAQRAGWEERVVPLAVVDDVRQLVEDPFLDMNNTVVVAGTLLAVVGLVLLARSGLPGEVVVFAVIVLGLALVSETLGPRPRFVLAAFPLFYAAAARLRGAAFSSVLGMAACALGGFTVLSVVTLQATP